MKKYIWPLTLVAATAATILLAWKFYKRKKFEVVIPDGSKPLITRAGEEVQIKVKRAMQPASKLWS